MGKEWREGGGGDREQTEEDRETEKDRNTQKTQRTQRTMGRGRGEGISQHQCPMISKHAIRVPPSGGIYM